jgi:hypothetical protein
MNNIGENVGSKVFDELKIKNYSVIKNNLTSKALENLKINLIDEINNDIDYLILNNRDKIYYGIN